MRVMIAVTHLLGTGHLRRALMLARAFALAGHDVLLTSGGMPVAGLDFGSVRLLQLPSLSSDGVDFTRLMDQTGQPAGTAVLTARRDGLCRAVVDFKPDVVITELFPFGRRVLRDEFLALLETAKRLPQPPVILSSVRDILAPPSTPAKAARTDDLVRKWYDAVLVHADPQGTKLEVSWPVSPTLAPRLIYTGYVAPAAAGPHPDRAGTDEVLVSAGGGPVGDQLFRCAGDAARLMPERRWRLLVGGQNPGARLTDLASGSPAVIEPARADFRQMLHHAAASVSMCGYNTALDLLQTGTPAVFVPFDDGNEVEQTLRAQSLARLPGMATLRTCELTPQRLCDAVRQVLSAPRRGRAALQLDGAAQTVTIATQMAGARI
ncbi:glycosyltransferase family protein [Sedimentitalea nanhaiensis]|uniref:Predicted glycosyl transferase n=1 Tax=Sedimentitalea nanhaiensis TaxID=999627 RepID=A0A1I6X8G3_9RHOB|nr:glycosyltransferase [Sedimentitalea nanhaiensis]SFT34084.1 Predicted glycosyl transferase [Sedimentitalea nanhaiensis]